MIGLKLFALLLRREILIRFILSSPLQIVLNIYPIFRGFLTLSKCLNVILIKNLYPFKDFEGIKFWTTSLFIRLFDKLIINIRIWQLLLSLNCRTLPLNNL